MVRKNSNVIGIKTGIGTDHNLSGNQEYSEVFSEELLVVMEILIVIYTSLKVILYKKKLMFRMSRQLFH